MFQLEYNGDMRKKKLTIFLIILAMVAVAGVVFLVIIKVGRKEFVISKPEANMEVIGVKGNLSSEQGGKQSLSISDDASQQMTQKDKTVYENANKQAESVQQQASEGKLSAEEARDRLREIGKSISVPPPPPTVKK